jgi:hypothetical protein
VSLHNRRGRMVAGFWSPTNPMHTAPISIVTPLAGHSVGNRYPETAPRTPSATYVRTHTGRGSAWISTGGQLSQRALNSNNPVDGHMSNGVMTRRTIALFACMILCWINIPSHAAEIYCISPLCISGLLNGQISKGDYEKVVTFLSGRDGGQ